MTFKVLLLVLPFVANCYGLPGNMESRQRWKTNDKLIIDVDPGIDDIEAITLLLNQHNHGNMEVIAIFISEGNTHQKYGIDNTFRFLKNANALQIPVFAGSNNPIMPQHEDYPENYFGKDGFGDLDWEGLSPPTFLLQQTIAPIALEHFVHKYPNQITYFTLGPMTNLAIAMRMYNGLSEKLKAIYAMAGLYRDPAAEIAEFNVNFDPESVEIVVDQLRCPMTFLTWQACLLNTPPRGWFNNASIHNPVFDMVLRAETALAEMHPDDLTWVSCDPMTAVVFIDSSAILESFESPVQVQLDSGTGRGVIRNFSNADHPGFERHPVKVITEIDMVAMQKAFLTGFKEMKTGLP